jgi:hypothetical protein
VIRKSDEIGGCCGRSKANGEGDELRLMPVESDLCGNDEDVRRRLEAVVLEAGTVVSAQK